MTKDSKPEIIAARKNGKSLSEIAVAFDMDKMDVRDICKDVKRTSYKDKPAAVAAK